MTGIRSATEEETGPRESGQPTSADDPRHASWPAEGLEHVEKCPVCGSGERSLLHDQLWDNVFFAAPGKWSLWRCGGCGSAYLDPRPDRMTIGLAYSRYYTHAAAEAPGAETAYQKLRVALANGYRNRRYGTSRRPETALGNVLARLVRPLAWPVDTAFRYLPRRDGSPKGRVLDLGCGGGEWLQLAREAGWDVAGSDPDPLARARAAARGIEVRDSIEAWEDQAETFDVVTMSHVIEHVHDPLATLRSAYRLLRPGGRLFVDTPNIDAIGHRIYGRDWRGLETPRHLVLFNRRSLRDALAQAGFSKICYRLRMSPFPGVSLHSRRIVAGADPYDESCFPAVPRKPRLTHYLRAQFARRRAEFLTLTAEKSAD